MTAKSTQKSGRRNDTNPVPAVSAVLTGGALIEMICDPERRQTAFAVWWDGAWQRMEGIEDDAGRLLEPHAFDNDFVRNKVVLFAAKPVEYGSQEKLIEDIRSFIHRYVELDSEFERFASYYVLFTWLHDAFNEVPYLRVRGDYGTGKTRFLQTVGSISYRPMFASGASTISPVFHMLDRFGGTLVIDEADFRFSDEKAEMVKILNNGIIHGMPVLRANMNRQREFEPRAFQVFGPKIVATRGDYDDKGLDSRFITAEMRCRKVRADIPLNLPNEHEAEARELRDKLLMYRFRNRGRCRLNSGLVDRNIEPRLNQMLVPLLSVVESAQALDALREVAQRHHESRKASA